MHLTKVELEETAVILPNIGLKIAAGTALEHSALVSGKATLRASGVANHDWQYDSSHDLL